MKFEQYTSVAMQITDMEGRLVREISVPVISGKLDIDISDLSQGMYMLNVYGDGEQVLNTKFVKSGN
ncbi:MAG TPA: T9SS type A sorting domain-containing protein [Bacteroidia bacterium]|nr:T9SS type A sorting domain-containing protein [Bacteroidia bacterium]